jgi:hypothetical protein
MKTYSIENLSKKQFQLIIESLLSSVSCDVNAKWYCEDVNEMLDLVIQLRQKNSELLTENVYVLQEPKYEKHTKKLLDFFPEILENIEVEG